MKHRNLLLLTSLIGLMSIGMLTGCGAPNSTPEGDDTTNPDKPGPENSDPENPDKPNPDEGNGGETTPEIDHTLRPDNDFATDPDTSDDNVIVEDTTPLDEGTLVDHKFEFESAEFKGASKGGHKCLAQSFEFNTAFSGNFCLKNISGGSTHTFTFTSDKAVRVPVVVGLSSSYHEGQAFGQSYEVSINKKDWVDTSATIGSDGKIPSGANQYFKMTTVELKVSLAKGDNKLVFQNLGSDVCNVDFINIKTSANIVDTTVATWPKFSEAFSVTKYPTKTETGAITYGCNHPGCSFSKPTKVIPNLDSPLYKKTSTKDSDIYSLSVGKDSFNVIESYSLTLKEGTLSDGSKSKRFFKGDAVTINYKAPEGKMLVGWKNVDKPEETFGVNFVMPDHPVTIAPMLDDVKTFKLELVNATFSDSSTSKDVEANSKPVINVPEIKGKKHIGFVNVNDKNEYTTSVEFIMPLKAMKIMPLYENNQIIGQNGANQGKLNLATEIRYDVNKDAKENQVAKKGVVGDELGILYDISFLKANGYFITQTPFRVNGEKFEITYVLENRGKTPLTLNLYQINRSSMPTTGNPNTGFFTIAPGEVVRKVVTISGYSNNNVLTTVQSKDVVNANLAMAQYFKRI